MLETFEVGGSYPTLLALPPGDQTRAQLKVYEPWLSYFQEQGWVVCCPVTPDGKLFFRGSERFLPQIMDHVEAQLNLAGAEFYLFDVSNSGISAFRVTADKKGLRRNNLLIEPRQLDSQVDEYVAQATH